MTTENRALLRALLGGAAATLPLTLLGFWVGGEASSADGVGALAGPAVAHALFAVAVGLRAQSPWTVLSVFIGQLLTWMLLMAMSLFGEMADEPMLAAAAASQVLLMAALGAASFTAGALLGRLLRGLGLGRTA